MIDDLLLHIHAAETIQAGISDGDIKRPIQVILRKAERLLDPQLQVFIVDTIFGKETGNELLRKAHQHRGTLRINMPVLIYFQRCIHHICKYRKKI